MFEKNRKLWREQKIANYEFHQVPSSGVRGPNYASVSCSVKVKKFDSIVKNHSTKDDPNEYHFYKTVDEIFDDIEKMAIKLKKIIKIKGQLEKELNTTLK